MLVNRHPSTRQVIYNWPFQCGCFCCSSSQCLLVHLAHHILLSLVSFRYVSVAFHFNVVDECNGNRRSWKFDDVISRICKVSHFQPYRALSNIYTFFYLKRIIRQPWIYRSGAKVLTLRILFHSCVTFKNEHLAISFVLQSYWIAFSPTSAFKARSLSIRILHAALKTRLSIWHLFTWILLSTKSRYLSGRTRNTPHRRVSGNNWFS